MVVKMHFKVYPRQGMTKDEFVNYWLNIHAPIAKQLPGLRKYVIDVALDTDGEEPGFLGKAELWFDSNEQMKKAFDSPIGKKATNDTKNFARKVTSVTFEEHVII
jgi:uncharacterized protein (TIGR02118 family)